MTAPLWSQVERNVSLFNSIANLGIRHAMVSAWSRCAPSGKPPQEPDFVAALVYDGIQVIGPQWMSVLGQIGVTARLDAVFCHQSPMVTWGAKKSCELGDLLLVHMHRSAYGLTQRRALLLQAKVSVKHDLRIPSGDKQLELYSHWPPFTYSRGLSGKRDIWPKTPHPGAQYLLIDSGPLMDPRTGVINSPGAYPMAVSPTGHKLVADRPLESSMVGLLADRSGRAFGARDLSRSGWTRTVWDLLETTSKLAFNRRNAGFAGTQRGVFSGTPADNGTEFTYSTPGFPDQSPGIERFFGEADSVGDSDSGISAIIIETNDNSDRDD